MKYSVSYGDEMPLQDTTPKHEATNKDNDCLLLTCIPCAHGYSIQLGDHRFPLRVGELTTLLQLVAARLINPGGMANLKDFELRVSEEAVLYQRIARLRRQLESGVPGAESALIMTCHGHSCSYFLNVDPLDIVLPRESTAALCLLLPNSVSAKLLDILDSSQYATTPLPGDS